ncbi:MULTISPECIES: VOC family protein [unclassified Sphingopyxis]|uniref:VOC family protein n=1 Tax=unclassified Sphingopyxis TaxID=2614943 RepID=UPI0007317824|nr:MULTISPECIES: VOC family protein [unclassified Sphingopyxis]KTE28160.1 bleomycin resistance protein [Sphingopyxis sp. H057]KTE55460.1 bleomycin resistance protein [Sphingopyxis sp. H073]KTE57653.1 bleomycin resistance protein [Sphingopyxis sp. H071]KTE61114.1 bleomycin resistance protein [Sphingopyxis sp. H107]KTE66347.1 bleomycin resistance protein [Sphingopyxis sp. H100]
MSGLNGVAHVILTAGDFARSTAFWRDMIGYLGLKLVLDSDYMLYGVGGRTAIGIRTPSPENAGKRFDQGAPGLHHACFRMRDRAAVDAVHAFLASRGDVHIVHAPQEEPWAPGYYSVLIEDPDGIRIEFNHVPGAGLLIDGEEIGGADAFDGS